MAPATARPKKQRRETRKNPARPYAMSFMAILSWARAVISSMQTS